VPHFILAGLDHVENAERGLVLVGGIDANFHLAAGHLVDQVGHLDHGIAENREPGTPGLGELPDDLLFLDRGLRRGGGLFLLLAAGRHRCQRNEHRRTGDPFPGRAELFHGFPLAKVKERKF